MELQLLYARIRKLLRHEFVAVQWKVYLEEEKHRLIIERDCHVALDGDVSLAYLPPEGLDGFKIEDDALYGKIGGVNGYAAGKVLEVKSETLPLVDNDVLRNGFPSPLPIAFDEDEGDNYDDDDEDGFLGSSWNNDDIDSDDGPTTKRRKRTKALEGDERRKKTAIENGDEESDDEDVDGGGSDHSESNDADEGTEINPDGT